MFDLFRSRDKAVRITLSVLLGLVGLSMVTYLIPTTGNDTGNTADRTVVASIGKEDLTSQEVSKVIQNMTRNRQLPPELLSIYVPQIVQQLISDRAMAFEANRLGMRVSSDETENAIIDSLPAEATKGGKVDSAMLNAVLQQQGVTMADLKDDTSRQILVSRLREIVSEGVVVSPREIADEFHRKNDKVRIDYALLQPARFQAEAEPTEAEVKAYYDSHKASFQTPEKRSLAIILLDPAKIQVPPATDAMLQKDYAAAQDRFKTPERVQARHILIKSDATNDAAMKAKAEGILKKIQAGGDFAKLAKENSDDPGSAAMGGELGFIVKGQTVPEFEKAAFSLQPGQTSGLVKTTYGYHIIQVEKHEQAHTQSFEEVRAQLLNEYQQRAAQAQMEQLADRAVAEMHKDPLHPEQAAQALGAMLIRAENIQAGDPIPGIGVSKEITDAVAPLRKGEATAGPVVLPGNKVAVVSVTDYQAAHQAALEEVKNDVRNKASQDKLQDILNKKSAELLAKATAAGGDLAKAAKDMGLEVKTSPDVNRQGAIEGIGSASTLSDAFTKPVGALFGPVSIPGGRVVAKIAAKIPADLTELPAQTAGIRDELRQQKTRDRTTMFEDGLKKRLQDQGKLKIHQDVITRLVQSYSQRS
ncbi:MAG TPA: peptidyl-prolyl cis-trans isomerase [Bryobacteraceae bacterium]|jgi:peptidyl-prolyl cis-trans isomerase D|nr:peptidyl-prolyl cis-trans isomerase [Bryobacteraceae bacterium]